MNKYLRALIVVPTGFLKTFSLKLFHFNKFKGIQFAQISPFTDITMSGGKLEIGKGFKMRDGAKIRVRNAAVIRIGKNVSISSNCIITSHNEITIGDNVQISPGVQVYDHDHDFRCEGGINEKKFISSPVVIGDNTWVGCNTVILKGTNIGKNCVIAAGSVVRGNIPANTVFVQKRANTTFDLDGENE